MGHSKLNLAIVAAGFLTLGASFGAFQGTAEAYPTIVLPDTLIVAEPIAACTEFQFVDDAGTVFCWDDGTYYDTEHYTIHVDDDENTRLYGPELYEGDLYLGVWE